MNAWKHVKTNYKTTQYAVVMRELTGAELWWESMIFCWGTQELQRCSDPNDRISTWGSLARAIKNNLRRFRVERFEPWTLQFSLSSFGGQWHISSLSNTSPIVLKLWGEWCDAKKKKRRGGNESTEVFPGPNGTWRLECQRSWPLLNVPVELGHFSRTF